MNCLDMLKREITEKMSLHEIVDAFERMCRIPIADDMILFETGTFSFTGEPLFYFSLVRQFPNAEEEYYQIHVDVLYTPDSTNQAFSFNVWDINIEENIFDSIRKSEAFIYSKSKPYQKIDIYMDET